jgi:hypothetical protein
MNWTHIWHDFLAHLCGSFFLFEITEFFFGGALAFIVSLLRIFFWEGWNFIQNQRIDGRDILNSLLGVILAFLI